MIRGCILETIDIFYFYVIYCSRITYDYGVWGGAPTFTITAIDYRGVGDGVPNNGVGWDVGVGVLGKVVSPEALCCGIVQ